MDDYLLLIEDNPADVDLTLMAFESNHFAFKVEIAYDGVQALELLRERSRKHLPSLILLDLNLPKMSGLEFLEAIRSDSRLSSLSVIVLTSSSREEDKKRAYELGVLDYIIKAVDFTEFEEIAKKIGESVVEKNPF